MRDISAITTDLQKTASQLNEKKKSHDDATAAATKALRELDAVQVKIRELRVELDTVLNALVPQSVQERVRQS